MALDHLPEAVACQPKTMDQILEDEVDDWTRDKIASLRGIGIPGEARLWLEIDDTILAVTTIRQGARVVTLEGSLRRFTWHLDWTGMTATGRGFTAEASFMNLLGALS